MEFEIELIQQDEVNVDYILMLVEKYHQSHGKDKEILTNIQKTVESTPQLRSKKELIDAFIDRIDMPLLSHDVPADWRQFVLQRKEQDLQKIIDNEGLRPQKTREFVENCFRNGKLKTTGRGFDDIIPRISRFVSKEDPSTPSRTQKKASVIQRLRAFFEKYLGLGLAHAHEETNAPEAAEERYHLAAEDEATYGHSPN